MSTLRDLGLSEYESSVYRELLDTGPTTAKELSRSSGVPMGRIYDVLADLEAAALVRSQQASRPKKYAAVEPETAFSRLLEDRRREAEAELAQFEAAVEELSDSLDSTEPANGQFYTVAIGPDDSLDLLLERLASATDHIDMLIADLSPKFDLGTVGNSVADEIEAAVERGVTVSALVAPPVVDAVPDDILARYGSLGSHDDFRVRTTAGIAGTVHVIDRVEICLGVANPLAPEEALALIALRDGQFARNLCSEFEPRWERAEPLGV